MDFDDRLKRLRKERASRAKAESVAKTWQKLDKNSDLTTREKLEKLISLTRTEAKKKAKPESYEAPARESLRVFDNHYSLHSRYGKISLAAGPEVSGEILSILSRDRSFAESGLSRALFLDLETTGLSGGVGVVPFLIGVGFYREDRFHVVQFFLGDPAEEENLIREFRRFLSQMDFRSIVTFNGKGFDLPLLETRFTLHRENLPLAGLPHLDFLFPARSLWGHKHDSCRLFHLAQEVLGADRGEDIPSAEIPFRYFQYLRSGDFSLMEPVLYHNQEDILSLLGVVIVGASFFAAEDEDVETLADAMDYFGVSKILEKTGELEKSALFIRRALQGRLSEEIGLLAKRKLASYFKKSQEWGKAISLWEEMTPQSELFCFRELSMYYEHKEKNYDKAKAIAEEGLALALGISKNYEEDFAHRLDRLRDKIHRKEKGTPKK